MSVGQLEIFLIQIDFFSISNLINILPTTYSILVFLFKNIYQNEKFFIK